MSFLNFKLTKSKRKIFKTFFFDLGFYASTILILIGLSILIKNKVADITNNLDYAALFSSNLEGLNQNLISLQFIVLSILSFIILSIIIIIILITIFKGKIWLELKNKKFSWKFFRKYLSLNLIYLIPSIIILLFVFFKYKSNIITISVILIILHFHVLATHFLVKENKVIKSFKQALKVGFQINLFIIPYLFIGAGFALLVFILSNIPYYNYYSGKLVINLIIYIFYFSVSRNYINNIFQKYL